jgi:hypothetical protein
MKKTLLYRIVPHNGGAVFAELGADAAADRRRADRPTSRETARTSAPPRPDPSGLAFCSFIPIDGPGSRKSALPRMDNPSFENVAACATTG